MRIGKRKYFFNLFGGIIVAFWVVMIGLLIKKTDFKGQRTEKDHVTGAATIDSAQQEWKEIYLKGKKVGYAINLIRPFEQGYFIQEEIFLKLNLMGLGQGLYTITQSSVDESFFLKNFYFKMASGVVSYNLSGRVEGDQLFIKTGRGKKQREQRIKLSEPPMISAGIGHHLKTQTISVGKSFRLPFLDPATMAQKEAVLKVVAREPLKINKISYDAYRLETEMWGKLMTFWLDQEGTILKEEGFMGLVTLKSSAANAPMDIEGGGGEDFYELTAVPINRDLPDPGKLSYLKVKVAGIDIADMPPGIQDDGRQKFSNGILEIRVEKRPFKRSYSIPYKDRSDEFTPFLNPEFNIESEVKEIVDMARHIAGKDTNPISVAGKLMKWVYDNLDKRPVVSVPSALEVLRTKVGDCNEHATLLTALLRASGIPARLSIGLVYTRKKFFYHAWTEAYVGEWISMDATMNQMPADVSHIRLMHGNLDKQVEIMGLIGKLKFEALDYEYD
ncbi:transglutaminase family protein [Thermodesulfobacteriota bacterium]